MAKQTGIPEPGKPLVTLTDEARIHIDAMGKELEQARSNAAAMKELGLNTDRIDELIEWSEKAREIVLKQLG